ncbi:MAG TPA: NADH-quinone oxidoreductase subunit NuoK [Deltaproteobacteria bacterium]|nr:MAG: NADH-quinone oxidoreductase subunit K [Deltaproteobacteria bacterium GWA2_55_82]OGQ64184.1 MAG: NADH-quinone oxidoreductase subunit K [Deltaproteobacteria bacterium RIFCSPLOWO2_02_FULL_55_12]OIJ74638.1 MAG: NADH-quinone oxidoreductase subunit K [Deltaproteobacteria bacterium GWC2_55_46]HBG46416.1 NADH-quinone oxidoreductase subunit NuoK [Deltaproteobacteria bacterium]HCY10628.1 NADH-quinone oxidoreductase subunit NuoK [Deltaproteobacteria bacterium]
MVPISWYIALAAILFLIGVAGVLTRRNIIIVLMSIELMLNSVNINFVAFSYLLNDMNGQIFTIFTITVTAAEVAVALGILIALVRNSKTFNVDELDTLKG